MTTPLGVPNLPIGALTVETLGEILQDMSAAAMRQRAGERFPDIFNLTTGGDVLADLTPFGILSAIWAAFNSQVATADPDDIQGPADLPGLLLEFVEDLPIVGILFKFLDALGLNPESVNSFLIPIFEFLNWLWELIGQEAETILKPIFEFLNWFLGFLVDRIDIAQFQALVAQLVDALGGFMSPQQFVDVFKTVIEFFLGLFTDGDGFTATITDFINKLPLIGPIVAAITGKTEIDGATLDLGTLQTYFRGLEDQVTVGVAGLTAAAEKLLGGIIPVGQISDTTINLLSQGDFLTSSTVDPAGGWVWDSTRTRTGTGGSLKVTCTGASQRIYCRQDIRVAEGDRLTLSGYVGTTGFTSGSMQLSIVPWGLSGGVMTAGTILNGTARTTSASTFQALSNLTYTVPAGVTSIQVSLVANCNTGCNVFFDDIKLTKTGVLPQGLVTNLLDAIQGILNGAGYVANTGWQFLETAIGFVTADATDALDYAEGTNTVLFSNPAGGTLSTLAENLGTAPTAGSGAKMSRKNTATKVTAAAGEGKFNSSFYVASGGGSGVDRVSGDITASHTNGRYTVTYAGWYYVEVAFATNASTPAAGYFNVAPAVYVQGTLYKVGADSLGSFGGGFGNYSRAAQSSFIVYLDAGQYVEAGYYNYGASNASFFEGDTNGVNTYFSIAMLNRTDEG